MPSDQKQLKSLDNARSGGLACEVPVGSLGVVGDVIKLKEESLNMMQISQHTMGEDLTIVGGSLNNRGENIKDIFNTVKYCSLFEESETKQIQVPMPPT